MQVSHTVFRQFSITRTRIGHAGLVPVLRLAERAVLFDFGLAGRCLCCHLGSHDPLAHLGPNSRQPVLRRHPGPPARTATTTQPWTARPQPRGQHRNFEPADPAELISATSRSEHRRGHRRIQKLNFATGSRLSGTRLQLSRASDRVELHPLVGQSIARLARGGIREPARGRSSTDVVHTKLRTVACRWCGGSQRTGVVNQLVDDCAAGL